GGTHRSRAGISRRGSIVSELPEPWGRWTWRRVRRWAVLLFITYLGITAVFWFLERRLVFHPDTSAETWLVPEDARSQDRSSESSDGNTIHARSIPPETPHHGAILVAHGNGGNLTHRGRLAADLRKSLGAGVLLFVYHGYGKCTGVPTEEGCYASGEAAYKWL